jgi:hypothetical protein
VKSIESLGEWEENHVIAFLRVHGYEDLSKEDFAVSLICSRLKSGWSLMKVLHLCEALHSSQAHEDPSKDDSRDSQ